MAPVTIYTKTWCPYCMAAKDLLESKGIAFEEIEISGKPELTSLVERSREALFQKIGPQEQDPTLASLREVARERGVMVHVGSIAVKSGEKVANRAFLIDSDGEIVASYDKIHLFDVDLP